MVALEIADEAVGTMLTSQPDFDALNSSGLVSRSFMKLRPSGKVRLMVILGARGPFGLTLGLV